MIWTKELVIELIEMLKAAPALWDIKCKEYQDKNAKYREISKMASHFKTNDLEISKKIKSVRSQFTRERKKVEEKRRCGIAVWFGYDMLTFLEGNVSKTGRTTKQDGAAENDDNMDSDTSVSSYEHESDDFIENIRASPMSTVSTLSQKRKAMNDDSREDEAYKLMRTMNQSMTLKDDFAVYGENVASRMRCANQSSRAISIAKNKIDNILFQLEMGEFAAGQVVTPGGRSSSNSHQPGVIYPSQSPFAPSAHLRSFRLPTSSLSTSATSGPSMIYVNTWQPRYEPAPEAYNIPANEQPKLEQEEDEFLAPQSN